MVIQGKTIEDLSDTYFKMKNILMRNGLIINPEKCEILTDELSDKINDEEAGIELQLKMKSNILDKKLILKE